MALAEVVHFPKREKDSPMWMEKVAAVASLGLVPAYRWMRNRKAQQSSVKDEREAYKPGADAVPMTQAPTVKRGGAAAETAPDGLARRGVTQVGFAPGEPLARPAVESERAVFQTTETGKGGDLPILVGAFPLM